MSERRVRSLSARKPKIGLNLTLSLSTLKFKVALS